MKTLYINGQWLPATGRPLTSLNPATNQTLWQGLCATIEQAQQAVTAAAKALPHWRRISYDQRLQYLQQFNHVVTRRTDELVKLISQETGKPRWDAASEVQALLGKLAISVDAFQQRSGTTAITKGSIDFELRHQSHGVLVVLGPYNFPCHLPNGHIIPALLAGNTLVFKPSELTPACGEFLATCWHEAGLPAGVFNLVQGAQETGKALTSAKQIAGVLFTGSEKTGKALHRQFAGRPEILLALEMGGNNPLIIEQNSSINNTAKCILESAFISAGQRCTCARRLLVPMGNWGDELLVQLVQMTRSLAIGQPDAEPSPFIGSMISAHAANSLLAQQQQLLKTGATALVPCAQISLGQAFISPGILDVSSVEPLPDEEIFGPLLQVIRYSNFAQAIELANQTRFGLSAGLISDNEANFNTFRQEIRAGIVNWNRPLTGASSTMPFGGVGDSGNHRPSAFYAADYCSFPVSSLKQSLLSNDSLLTRFLSPSE